MRAVVCHEIGAFDRVEVEEVPTPEPGPGQVRLAIRAAGVSYVDGLLVAGRYQFPMEAPYVPGGEAAGVIDAVGEGVEDWHQVTGSSDRSAPAASPSSPVASPRQLRPPPRQPRLRPRRVVPAGVRHGLVRVTRRTVVRPGEVVLVTGAGGGVGLAAIDVARSLGARVIAVASTEEKRAIALAAGAEAAIDPTSEDVKVRARELTGGAGIDVVYDVVGGEVSEAALRALKFDGRFCVIGFTGGIARVPLNLVLLNNRTVIGVEWGGWVMRFREENRALIDEVVEAIAAGTLRPIAPTERPLDEAVASLTDLLERRTVGKVVIVP